MVFPGLLLSLTLILHHGQHLERKVQFYKNDKKGTVGTIGAKEAIIAGDAPISFLKN